MQTTTFDTTQKQTVTLQFLDSGGTPTAPPATVPTYSLMDDFGNVGSDKGVVALTPATDGLSVVVAAVAAGSQRVRVNGDIGADFTVTVSIASGGPGPAVSLNFLFATPVPK